jgi:FKBP-type peptidyl-prolyl cis-trans isomerase FklB
VFERIWPIFNPQIFVMKKILIAFTFSGFMLSATAQKATPKPQTKSPVKPATTTTQLKSATDSLSYALGMNTALFFKSKGITNINATMVAKAVDDVLKGKTMPLTEEQMNKCAMEAIQKADETRVGSVKKEGAIFLAKNKTKAGVTTLPSGLQYEVLKQGNGPKPTASDKVKVHYHGTLIDGTVFDSSVDRGQPIELSVGGVIQGWVEALQMMPVGSKWKLYIPSELGYGDRDAGPTIKGGSALIFEVELIEIVK